MSEPTAKRSGRYRLHPPSGVDAVSRRRVGDPNPRGRLDRLTGPFLLREGLAGPGDMTLLMAFSLVGADWARQVAAGTISAENIATYTKHLSGFLAVLARLGVTMVNEVTPNLVLAWCQMRAPHADTDPNENSMRLRRSAARSFFETSACLGITDANPAKTVEFPGRSGRHVRAFTDGDISQLQRISHSTLGDTRTPCALALVMSGASTQELAFVTVDDVDLARGRLWVHDGGYRARDRWVPFCDDWSAAAVAARVAELRESYGDEAGGVWLIYKPHPSQPTPTRQASAGNNLITRLLKTARVHEKGVTRAESIREWLAAQVFAQTGSVEEVAIRLGYASLDAAAHLVGYDWVDAHESTEPAPAHRQHGGAA